MAVRQQYLAYVLEQLAPLGKMRWRRMFGAIGLYCDDLFFGLIGDDVLYFKADAASSAPYLARKMPRFMPDPNKPDAVLGYFQVPAEIIEDNEEILSWARTAVAVALARSKPKAESKAKAKSKARKPAKAKSARKTARRPQRPRSSR